MSHRPQDSDYHDSFESSRHRLIDSIARHGIRDERVLAAMRKVPRHEFVDSGMIEDAYGDFPLPIGQGQTISQPFTVAFMAEAAQLESSDRVLEIGAGCGYSAAVLAQIVQQVVSIERIPELAMLAEKNLARAGIKNVLIQLGDGTLGWPAEAPYQAILVTAGGQVLPTPLIEQLDEGGRIVIPLGDSQSGQTMYRFTKSGADLRRELLGQFAFVPLVGEHGW